MLPPVVKVRSSRLIAGNGLKSSKNMNSFQSYSNVSSRHGERLGDGSPVGTMLQLQSGSPELTGASQEELYMGDL